MTFGSLESTNDDFVTLSSPLSSWEELERSMLPVAGATRAGNALAGLETEWIDLMKNEKMGWVHLIENFKGTKS